MPRSRNNGLGGSFKQVPPPNSKAGGGLGGSFKQVPPPSSPSYNKSLRDILRDGYPKSGGGRRR